MNYKVLFDMIGTHMQLPENKFNALKDNYDALSTFISNNHQLSSEEGSVYTQGSFAIDTAIQPLKGGEIDVDMVVEFADEWIPGMQVQPFYEALENMFKESNRYKNKVGSFKNVVRINYVGDYHFDIMPALKHPNKEEGYIKCVDTKKSKWIERAPKPYRDWFKSKAELHPKVSLNIRDFQLFRDMSHEDLEKPTPYFQKSPLIRSIQLIKRARDSFFRDEDDYVPQSIVLTTMIASIYQGERKINDLLFKIVHYFRGLLESNKEFKVFHPVKKTDEEFTDKWHDKKKYYDNFIRFTLWLHYRLSNLLSTDNHKHYTWHIKELFGPSVQNYVGAHKKYLSYQSFMKPKDRLTQDVLMEDKYELDLRYPIQIEMKFINKKNNIKIYDKHKRLETLSVGGTLEFSLKSVAHIKKDIKYHWKVRNKVSNFDNHPVRGEIQNEESISETTNFKGKHFVECYLTHQNKIIAYDRIDVPIHTDF